LAPEPVEGFDQVSTAAVATDEVIAETEPDAATPTEFEPAGAVKTRATSVNESALAIVHPDGKLTVTGVELKTSTRCVGIVPTVSDVGDVVVPAAVAGATEVRTPKPKAATATSAMRLKVVFVDICFLSISRSEEFPPVGFG